MRQVFNNDMVMHVWAQQSQSFGRNSSNSTSFRGPELISYNTTIALHFGSFVLCADPSQFSVTTNRHTPSGYDVSPARIIYAPDLFSWGSRYNYKNQYPKGTEVKKSIINQLKDMCLSYSKRRAASTKAYDHNSIAGHISDLKFICEHYSLAFPAKLSTPEKALGTTKKEIAKLLKVEKKQRAKVTEQKKSNQKEAQKKFEQWLDGQVVSFPYTFKYGSTYYLTIRDNKVITSGGAECPVHHAKEALNLYRAVTKGGEKWSSNEQTCRLGHFKLDVIDAAGNARAGCHRFSKQELERFQKRWNI